MSNNDSLASCLSKVNNAEKVSKNEVVIYGASKIINKVLEILQKNNYLGKIKNEQNTKGGKIIIELIHHINVCGAIKPRFKVKAGEIEKFEQRFLPARNFGVLIMSTSRGLVTNYEAKEKKTGGRLIAYCY